MTLSAEDIAKIADFTVETVDVPEWGGAVSVRTLNADQRDEFVSRFIDSMSGRMRPGSRSVTATLLAMCVCDEHGNLLFAELEKGRQFFAMRSARACNAVFEKACELNALTEAEVVELAKN